MNSHAPKTSDNSKSDEINEFNIPMIVIFNKYLN